MAIQLNENQLGFDAGTVGFPSLGDCMGVVVETPTALYGFHHMPNPATRVAPLRGFIAGQGDDIANATRLYGCARFGRRYGGKGRAAGAADWRAEMGKIASAIGYTGHVAGVDLSRASHTPKDGADNQTVYLEYVRGAGGAGCAVRYKRMSKMAETPGGAGGAAALGIMGVRMDNATGGFVAGATPHKVTAGMHLDTTKTSSAAGVMHAAGSFITFTHA